MPQRALAIVGRSVLAFAILGAALAVTRATDAPAPRSPEAIQKLIDQLGAEKFRSREQAAQELEKLGAAALPALRQRAAEKTELEIKVRTEQLIGRIEKNLVDEAEKQWAALGKPKHALQMRLSRLLKADPPLSDPELVRAVYLLTILRAPTESEAQQAEKQLKQADHRLLCMLDLAWGLVQGCEFHAELAGVTARVLDIQQKVFAAAAFERSPLLNNPPTAEWYRTGAVALAKATDNDAQLHEAMFLLTLTRYPTQKERGQIEDYVKKMQKEKGPQARVQVLEDLLFAMMNTREFLTDRP